LLGTEEMENGPVVSRLRCKYRWALSYFQLDLFAWKGVPEIEASFTGEWLEKRTALKLALTAKNSTGEVVSGQAASLIRRAIDECEQPFIDYAVLGDCGIFTDTLHSYDTPDRETLRLTLFRTVSYAEHAPNLPHGDESFADWGQQRHRFWIFSDFTGAPEEISRQVYQRLLGCEHLEITATDNHGLATWNHWEIKPDFIVTTAQRVNQDGQTEFHLFNPAARPVEVEIACNDKVVKRVSLTSGGLKKLIL